MIFIVGLNFFKYLLFQQGIGIVESFGKTSIEKLTQSAAAGLGDVNMDPRHSLFDYWLVHGVIIVPQVRGGNIDRPYKMVFPDSFDRFA